MKRMKRVIAAVLVAMMAFGITGCSKAEIGYLNMAKESATWSGMAVDETIVVDFQGDFLKKAGLEKMGNHMELKATGTMGVQATDMDLTMTYRLNAKDQFQPLLRMVMQKDKMMMSTAGIWQIAKTYVAEEEKWSPEFIADMDAYIKANPYVLVDAASEAGDITVMTEDIMKQAVALMDTLIKNHEGFSTDMITEKDGGYQIKATLGDVEKSVDNWFAYAQKNTTNSYNVYNAVFKYVATAAAIKDAPMTQAEWTKSLAEVQAGWKELKTELNKVTVGHEKDAYEEFTKVTGEKGSRVCTSDVKLTVKDIVTVTMQSKATEQVVKITPVANATKIDAFAENMQKIVDKYVKLDSIVLTPGANGEGTVEVTISTFGQKNTDKDTIDMVNVGGAYCVSVDDLNGLTNNFYVMVNDNKATATYGAKTAVLDLVVAVDQDEDKDDKDDVDADNLYVKVRDLAKVGFTVQYTANPERITLK